MDGGRIAACPHLLQNKSHTHADWAVTFAIAVRL